MLLEPEGFLDTPSWDIPVAVFKLGLAAGEITEVPATT
jgi:hypothetical protein